MDNAVDLRYEMAGSPQLAIALQELFDKAFRISSDGWVPLQEVSQICR